ncbi:MAG TPA: hypothetical protein VN769_03410 [Xanthobacteraceae bacterium]|nr:hypothetical protein [Xanthobacteraceae bacterium]
MADYYPVLFRAVSSLPHNNAQARLELYARARAIVAEELRTRDPRELTSETSRERAALETAIHRVETEAEPRPKTTARRLATILRDLESHETRTGKPELSKRSPAMRTKAPVVRAPPNAIDTIEDRRANAYAELGGIPNSLGVMLLGIAFIVTAMTFTAVTYIRAAVWLHQGVIGYPVLLLVMAIAISLFIIPLWAAFRKTSNGPMGVFLLRLIYSKSRRAR